MAASIDAEVRALIEAAHVVALDVLTDNRDVLDRLATELIVHETLEAERVQAIFADVAAYGARPASSDPRARTRPESAPTGPGRTSAAAAAPDAPATEGRPRVSDANATPSSDEAIATEAHRAGRPRDPRGHR